MLVLMLVHAADTATPAVLLLLPSLLSCRCMGERSEAVQQECEAELDSIAARLCTALTTLHDYPVIRYRVGKPPEAGDAPGASVRTCLAQRLAQKVGACCHYPGTTRKRPAARAAARSSVLITQP